MLTCYLKCSVPSIPVEENRCSGHEVWQLFQRSWRWKNRFLSQSTLKYNREKKAMKISHYSYLLLHILLLLKKKDPILTIIGKISQWFFGRRQPGRSPFYPVSYRKLGEGWVEMNVGFEYRKKFRAWIFWNKLLMKLSMMKLVVKTKIAG